MGLKLLFFVCLAVSASAVSEDEYDSYDGWWSQEVPSADLGIVDSAIDKLIENGQGDYPFYDTSDETPDNTQREEEEKSDDHVAPLLSILNDSENSKSSDEKIVPEEIVANDENVSWDELRQAIKYDSVLEDENASSDGDKESKNNKEIDDNDYLVEDNRSDIKNEDTRKDSDAINNDDTLKDYVDLDLGINSHEFDENLENIEFENEQSPDVPSQIVEDAEKILEEENGAYEEDIEGTDLVVSEDKYKETSVSELDNIDNDDTKERLDNIVESFINEMEKDKSDKYENNDEDVDNGFEDITLLKKYGNDMIDPGETNTNDKNINSSEQEDSDEKEQDFGDDENDEDTVDKVYQDLNADLDKLFATWDKLTADDSKLSSEETSDENGLSIEEYEEKYGRPYKEGVVLNQRDNFNPENYDDVIDSIIEDNDSDSVNVPSIVDLSRYLSQEDENTSKDISKVDGEVNTTPYSTGKPIIDYMDDKKEEEIKTKQAPDVDVVTEKDYADLIYEFSIDHHDKIATNVQEESVSAIYMTLEADKTIEITSPNYPNAYPANNVVDWILEGEEGVQGIELNITDLDLRGAQGDYLLINPGGARDGQGLLFSYHLPVQANLRQYRFTSTNRLYIRFNAEAGLNFLPGFRLTVKPIWSLSSDEEEDLPNPEALLPSPAATLTVNLGGLRLPYFYEVKDIFRRIVADMATMYINANSIDPGMNTTLETTQITNVASCNVNWPSFEECVAVSFGVPLFYEADSQFHHDVRLNQDDLITMWMTYVKQDPFAARLRVLGITEFAVPNDNRITMMWAVLGIGILIAATTLGFALWRFSCFEGYSRMKEFDTSSLNQSKCGLDLYPTPHQPLPPLYADNDFKWADSKYDDTTRVDLGGLANRSYARDELLDIESDEDNIAPRDRNAGFSPRNVYQV